VKILHAWVTGETILIEVDDPDGALAAASAVTGKIRRFSGRGDQVYATGSVVITLPGTPRAAGGGFASGWTLLRLASAGALAPGFYGFQLWVTWPGGDERVEAEGTIEIRA